MSDRDDNASRHQEGDAEHLGSLVKGFQCALEYLRRAQEVNASVALRDEQQRVLEQPWRQTMSDAIDELYRALEPDLQKLAGGWIRSKQFHQIAGTREFSAAVRTLAMSAFSAIIDSLPMLRIDPNRNVRKLLITIARRDLYDQERKIFNPGPRDQIKHDGPLKPGDPDAAMWQPRHEALSNKVTASIELKDGASTDFEEQIIDRDRSQRLWPIVTEFLQENLSPEDLWLIQMRWFHEPPMPFKAIAQHLGEGWSEAAVKERHYRILKRTRKYLHDQGLLDATDTTR